VDDWT
jgi:hypothetical protein